MNSKVAILLTSYNRKSKTIACLESLYKASVPSTFKISIFLVDDGSTDGTFESVKKAYPFVNLIKGSGNLYWAGGMRLAWDTALRKDDFDFFLLVNDDVVLFPDYFENIQLILTHTKEKTPLFSAGTIDQETNKVTYGALKIKRRFPIPNFEKLIPNGNLQECDMTNANILLVSRHITNSIGILDSKFTHGIADYDYSLRAKKAGFSAYLLPKAQGFCTDDHGNNWAPSTHTLKQRIQYLKSPKGLAYKEYIYYIKKHFPLYLPYSFAMLWMKTLFPSIWENHKRLTK